MNILEFWSRFINNRSYLLSHWLFHGNLFKFLNLFLVVNSFFFNSVCFINNSFIGYLFDDWSLNWNFFHDSFFNWNVFNNNFFLINIISISFFHTLILNNLLLYHLLFLVWGFYWNIGFLLIFMNFRFFINIVNNFSVLHFWNFSLFNDLLFNILVFNYIDIIIELLLELLSLGYLIIGSGMVN